MNIRLLIVAALTALPHLASANGNVYVSRMWHNHQPVYWPEWNGNGSQTNRMQYAWDSIWLKENADQTYGTGVQHPDNNLRDIFGLDDRRNAYPSASGRWNDDHFFIASIATLALWALNSGAYMQRISAMPVW